MKLNKISVLLVLIFSIITFFNCSGDNGTSIIIINVGLQNQQAHNSFFYKLINFIQKPVYADPPSNIQSITINITAADFSPITRTYTPPYGIFRIEAPSGIQRAIEVLASTPSATIRGFAIVDLKPGEQTVDISMHLYSTKILVPDYTSHRLVQMDDMTGNEFVSINGSTISFPGGIIYPYDVDSDDIGRIYIANYGFSTGQDVVIRLNDITATTYTSLGTGGMNGIKSVAVDRGNKLVYYATNNQLYRCDYNGSNLKNDYTMTGITNIQGIAYHNGTLYIACTYASNYRIVKYDITGNGQITGYSSASLHSAWDVIIKNDLCIVADDDESTLNDSIVILDPDDLSLFNKYGTGTSLPSPLPGQFWGPRRFVAILNDRFYLIDERDGMMDNLVSFSDLTFSNWERYDDTIFMFFSFC